MTASTLILVRLCLKAGLVVLCWCLAAWLIVSGHPWAAAVFVVLGLLCGSGDGDTPKAPPHKDAPPEPPSSPDKAVKPKLEPECLR
jgi:hypothetical protein